MVDMSGDSKPYEPGDTILRCDPFAHVVSKNLSTNICDCCLKRTEKTLQRCSSCRFVRYCGPKCQKKSWRLHRDECNYLKFISPKIPTDTVRLMARIFIKLKNGGCKEAGILPDGSKRGFEDLITHQKQIVRDEKRMDAFLAFYEVLKCCGDFFASLPKQEVFEVFGRILINSFNIMDDEYQPIGIGLYLAPSALDHSCVPNAAVVFKGKEIQVRCIKNISNFCNVRISYTNLIKVTATRQKDLMEQYYFECSCEGCNPPSGSNEEYLEKLKTGSVVCAECKGAVIVESSGICNRCNKEFKPEEIEEFTKLKNQVVEFVFENKHGHPDPLDQAEEFCKDMKGKFHPANMSFLPLAEHLTEKFISEERWEQALEYCNVVVEGYQNLYPRYDVNTALMWLKIGKLASYVGKDNDAKQAFKEAKGILKVTHGTNHPLYSGILYNLISDLNSGK